MDRDAVIAVQRRTAGLLRRTPVVDVEPGALTDAPVTVKLELLQHSGSFKARGMYSKVTAATEVPDAGFVIASGGNAGAALAHAGSQLGHRVCVFVPSSSPAMKRDRLAKLGAEVIVVEGHYDDAYEASLEYERERGARRVHAYDDLDVVAGQGMVFAEFEEQAPGLDTVLVAVGGGGLIGGALAWYGDRVKVVSVEPETSQCLRAAVRAGEPVDADVSGIAADSLGARRIGNLAWSLRGYLDAAVVVPDDAIAATQRRVYDELRIVAEPGGAAALAALVSGVYRPAPGERVGVLICGGNCDPASVLPVG